MPLDLDEMAETINLDDLDGRVRKAVRACAASLQTMTFPPVKYIVPGLVPEGLTLFAGKPKIGKSWACLEIALSVSLGGQCFGDTHTQQGNVLYCALEDNLRRLQGRMQKLFGNFPWPIDLDFQVEMSPVDPDDPMKGCIEEIEEWRRAVKNPRLVILDTLQRIRPPRRSSDSEYQSDYKALQSIQAYASQHGIAIIIVHHVRKMGADDPIDTISGTLGLAGSADSVMVLDRGADGCTLHCRGRDIEESTNAMVFDRMSCRWKMQGEAKEVNRSNERRRILEALVEAGDPMNPTDLAHVTEMRAGNIRKLLFEMVKAGDVIRQGRGLYAHPANVTAEQGTEQGSGNNGNNGNNVVQFPDNSLNNNAYPVEENVTEDVTDPEVEDPADPDPPVTSEEPVTFEVTSVSTPNPQETAVSEEDVTEVTGVTGGAAESEEPVTFAARVKAAREARGWSQYELAAAAGIHRSGVAHVEMGRRDHNAGVAKKIAAALGLEATP